MEPNFQAEPMEICESLDGNESNDPDCEENLRSFKEACKKLLAENILSILSFHEELSLSDVERSIRDLRGYREDFYGNYGGWKHKIYTFDILPNILPLWWFALEILSDEYYREVLDTILFLSEVVGSHFMIEIIVGKLMAAYDYITSKDNDRAWSVMDRCLQIAMEAISKITLTSHFDPANLPSFVEETLTHIIYRYYCSDIRDSVLGDSINTIIDKLGLWVESSELDQSNESIDLELTELCRAIDSDESNVMNNVEIIRRFKKTTRRTLEINISRVTSSSKELSPRGVERAIRDLQHYRKKFDDHHGRWENEIYTSHILPFMMSIWTFDTVILSDKYYRELIDTSMFLSEVVGSHFMFDIVLGNLMEIDHYTASGDRANLVEKQCHKMAMETIAKIITTTDFDPSIVPSYLKEILTKFIRRHTTSGIQDPVMDDSINTIVKELKLDLESSDSSQAIDEDESDWSKKQGRKRKHSDHNNDLEREPSPPDTHRESSLLVELPPINVEWNVRVLQDIRTHFRNCLGLSLDDEYIQEVLPITLSSWSSNIAILKDEYFQEIIKTVMFLAEVIGPQVMINIILENLKKIDDYFASRDCNPFSRPYCLKIAKKMIPKMTLTKDFDPTKLYPVLEQLFIIFNREYEKEKNEDSKK